MATTRLFGSACQEPCQGGDVFMSQASLQDLRAALPAARLISAGMGAHSEAAAVLAATICPHTDTPNVLGYRLHGFFYFPKMTAHHAPMLLMSFQ